MIVLNVLGAAAVLMSLLLWRRARASERRCRALLMRSPDAIFVESFDGRVLEVNEAACRLHGMSRDELIGRHVLELVSPRQREKVAAEYARLIRGECDYAQGESWTKDGRAIPIELRASRFDYRDRPALLLHVRDISQRLKSEEALRAREHEVQVITENIPALISYVDTNLRYRFVNRMYEQWFHRPSSEFVGLHIREVMGEKVFAQLRPRVERVLAGHRVSFEDGYQFDDASRRSVVGIYVPDLDEEGKVRGFYVLVSDITETKRAQDALHALAEATATVVGTEFFARLVRCLARTLQVRYVIVAEHLDKPTTRVRTLAFWSGDTLADDVEYEVAGTPCEPTSRGQVTFFPDHLQEQFPDHDLLRELGVHSYCGLPLTDASGQVLGHLAILDGKPMDANVKDLPALRIFAARAAAELERLHAERKREYLQEELRHAQKLEAVGTLASGVAHDFNNLLTAIFGYTDLARATLPEDHPARRALAMVDQAAAQASGVARALSSFTHKSPAHKCPTDLAAAIGASMRLLRRVLPASVRIEQQLPEGPLWVCGDETQLQQVMINLAVNARDAMPEGGQLHVTLCEHEGEAVVQVRDTGVGMTPQVRQRVFEPFFTTKPRGEGTGLGLPLIHGIVTDHGGRIEIASELGAGACFTITLPCCPPPPAEIHERMARQCHDGVTGGAILLADHHDYVRSIMASALRGAGYEVIESASAAQAVAVLEDAPQLVSLAIVSMDLPDYRSLGCAEALQRRRPGLAIIIVAGEVQALDGPSMARGVRLLRKPFRMTHLTQLVAASLAGRVADDERTAALAPS